MNDENIFVKLDKHKEIGELLKNIKSKAVEARIKLEKIRALDDEENVKFAGFEEAIEKINANLDNIEELMRTE